MMNILGGSRVPRDRNEISTKGTRVATSGGLLSCAFHQQ